VPIGIISDCDEVVYIDYFEERDENFSVYDRIVFEQ
jgi:hypothetical protein